MVDRGLEGCSSTASRHMGRRKRVVRKVKKPDQRNKVHHDSTNTRPPAALSDDALPVVQGKGFVMPALMLTSTMTLAGYLSISMWGGTGCFRGSGKVSTPVVWPVRLP